MKLFILEDVQLKKRLAKIYQKGSGLYIEGAKAPQTLYKPERARVFNRILVLELGFFQNSPLVENFCQTGA